MTKQYDYIAFILRGQPLHDPHADIIRKALELSHHVITLVGSSFCSRSPRNPFTYDERKEMIVNTFHSEVEYEKRLHVAPVRDTKNNDRWIASVHRQVNKIVMTQGFTDKPPRIALIGYGKDESSFYLKMFPEWGSINVEGASLIDATAIRNQFFTRSPVINDAIMPKPVADFLKKFRSSTAFKQVTLYREDIEKYKKSWEGSPFPPVFITVDNVVIQSGHVLLIRRGREPGKGLLALPGGFLQKGKSLKESAVNELKEETEIADQYGPIPPAKLASFIQESKSRVFDDTHRSERGRTVTHVFQYALPNTKRRYAVKGGDDAEHAAWYSIADLKSEDFFEDHYQILEEMNIVTPQE